MHHDTVMRNSGETEGSEWYDNLRGYYDWNGRYWDQRELFESDHGQHEAARSYAERSILVHPHFVWVQHFGDLWLLRMAIIHGSIDALMEGSRLGEGEELPRLGRKGAPFHHFFHVVNSLWPGLGIFRSPTTLEN